VNLRETPLPGAYVVELEPIEDERGWFARTFDAAAFEELGLDAAVVQCNASFNRRAGTLRGMHYQAEPHGEAKLVRCTRGAIFDVIVDLRPWSATTCRWFGIELRAGDAASLFVPAGFAHGFQTLGDDTEVHYQMSHRYVPEAARGLRWNDPSFAIDWPPAEARMISERDRTWPDYSERVGATANERYR
jgi:dTDP-4-dehydrorhamnose 3,5-epimerase